MNNLLILKLNENNITLTNLQKAGGSYQFATENFVDSNVSTQRLTLQLMNLALRKSGAQMPQGEGLTKFRQSVETCRKELAQYDSEIALPDGRFVEIEQYEYQNAVTAIINKIADDVRFIAPNPTSIGKVIILANEADVPLLRSLFLRTFGATIGSGKAETEWLSVNDKTTADKAIAEAQARRDAEKAARERKPKQETRNTGTRNQGTASRVEGAYTGQTTTKTQPNRGRQAKPVTPKASNTRDQFAQFTKGRNKDILIVAAGVCIAAFLGIIFIAILASTRQKHSHNYDISYNNTEQTEVTTDAAEQESSTPSATSDNTVPVKDRYDYVYPASDGLRKVEKDGKKGFVDADGNEVVPPIYDYIYAKSDGLFKVEQNGKKGFINPQGKVVIPVKYDYIYAKADGMYKVEIGNKKGFIRADGTVFIPVKYDYIYAASDGLYKVEVDSKKGFVDATTGKEICAPVYDYIYSFSGGLAKVEKDGKTGYIDRTGKLVRPME